MIFKDWYSEQKYRLFTCSISVIIRYLSFVIRGLYHLFRGMSTFENKKKRAGIY